MGKTILIKADGAKADPHTNFWHTLVDNEIIVYAHKFQSIKTYFRRNRHFKLTTAWYALDKKIYGVAGSYRKGRWMPTEVYDHLDLRHKGWGLGSIGGNAGFTGVPIVDDLATFGLQRAMTTRRCFVALTMDDLIPPSSQKFIYGQEFPTEVFLESGPPITFGDVYEALRDRVRTLI